MGFFNFFDKVGILKDASNCKEQTTGVVKGISTLRINTMHLPMVEYEVDGVKYSVRMGHGLAKKLEKESTAEAVFVPAPNSNALNPILQRTKIQGMRVKVIYNKENPKEALVEELEERKQSV